MGRSSSSVRSPPTPTSKRPSRVPRDAQRRWAQVPVTERAAACTRAVEWCVAHADELAAELTSQMGRPIAHSPFEITRGFQERARYMASIAASALADIEIEHSRNFHKFIRRAPLGVVLVLAPWNYPWLTSVNAIIPALLAGNAVILKMAQQTPLVAERYAEAFAAAGLPDGVFQYLHVDHDQVERMIGDERIAFVAFTGSVAGGHAVQRAAADRFIGMGLELGRQGRGLRARRRRVRPRSRKHRRRRVLQRRAILLLRAASVRRSKHL